MGSSNVPGVALYFYSLSAIRGRLSRLPYFSTTPAPAAASGPSSARTRSTLPRLSSQGNLIAGSIARTSVGIVLNPITILKARYESSSFAEYRSLYAAFRSLLADGGVRGLFRGWVPTAARDAPYAGMSLLVYEKCKDVGGRMGLGNAATHSGSGAAAATLATLLTSPADVVKVSHGPTGGEIEVGQRLTGADPDAGQPPSTPFDPHSRRSDILCQRHSTIHAGGLAHAK